MDTDWQRTLDRAVRALCAGADAVCDDLTRQRGVPRLNTMTGGYTWDDEYVWDSWANFQ
jgi:unsaturated chondroitin disaccharide hydrolase